MLMSIFHRKDSILLLHKNMAASDNGYSLQLFKLSDHYTDRLFSIKNAVFFPDNVFMCLILFTE